LAARMSVLGFQAQKGAARVARNKQASPRVRQSRLLAFSFLCGRHPRGSRGATVQLIVSASALPADRHAERRVQDLHLVHRTADGEPTDILVRRTLGPRTRPSRLATALLPDTNFGCRKSTNQRISTPAYKLAERPAAVTAGLAVPWASALA
jgi:hypothetical protein